MMTNKIEISTEELGYRFQMFCEFYNKISITLNEFLKTDYVKICGISLYLEMWDLHKKGLTLGDVQNQTTENFNQVVMKQLLESVRRNSKNDCFEVLFNLWVTHLMRASLLADVILQDEDTLYFQSCGWLKKTAPKNDKSDSKLKCIAKRINRDISVYIGDYNYLSDKNNFEKVKSGNSFKNSFSELLHCEKCTKRTYKVIFVLFQFLQFLFLFFFLFLQFFYFYFYNFYNFYFIFIYFYKIKSILTSNLSNFVHL